MIALGIDNGKDGALVVLDAQGGIMWKVKTPIIKARTKTVMVKGKPKSKKLGRDEWDVVEMRELLVRVQGTARESNLPLMAYVEKGQPFPSKMGGSVGNFQRGLSLGLWTGLLVGVGIPYNIIAPQRWQREMFKDVRADDTKQAASIVCRRLWPRESWKRTDKCRNDDEGFCDAALIAAFGKRDAP